MSGKGKPNLKLDKTWRFAWWRYQVQGLRWHHALHSLLRRSVRGSEKSRLLNISCSGCSTRRCGSLLHMHILQTQCFACAWQDIYIVILQSRDLECISVLGDFSVLKNVLNTVSRRGLYRFTRTCKKCSNTQWIADRQHRAVHVVYSLCQPHHIGYGLLAVSNLWLDID